MTSLITGGAGFIGSHLAEALLGRGGEVIILDDLSTGSVENIRHFRTNPSRSKTGRNPISSKTWTEDITIDSPT